MRLFVGLRTGSLAPLLAALAIACGEDGEVPERSSEAHREAVTTFYVGLAAAQVGLEREAEEVWLETIDHAPGEPAAWADLAVLALRRAEPELAASRVEEAVRLAPENARLRYLAGRIEIARGRWEGAAERLRRAVELDPDYLPAIHALVELAERGRGEEAAAEAGRWLERVLEVAPENLAARVERARLAARRGDEPTLGRALRDLRRDAPQWSPEARERLGEVEAAAATGDATRTATGLAMVENVLRQSPEFRRDLAELQPIEGERGLLFERPLRLPPSSGTPATPDPELTFVVETLPAGGDDRGIARAVFPDAERDPIAIVLTGSRVLLPDGSDLPFPGPDEGPPTGDGLLAADLDNDLRVDFVLAGESGLRILRQGPGGTFADVTRAAGLPDGVVRGRYTGVWAVDLDLEGDLDLVLGVPGAPPLVLINEAGEGFARSETFAGPAGVADLAWADLDGDGDADVILLGSSGKPRLFRFSGAGRFRESVLPDPGGAALAILVTELDGDDRLDLVVLVDDGTIRRIAPGGEPGGEVLARWERMETGAGEDARLFAADLDNNGCVDLVVSVGSSSRAWLCDDSRVPAARVVEIAGAVHSVADLDGDGRIDLLGAADGRPARFLNRGRAGYGWVKLGLRAAERAGDRRVNPYGLGGEVEVRSGLLYQKRLVEEPVIHLGLGERDQADLARIVWPNGLVQAEFGIASERTVVARQRLMGSCPWLFAWDGERMEFVTDVLWRSPLGMRSGGHGTIPVPATEDRVLIRGERIAPKEGRYELRITSELWETFYFDHVSLIAVDHPPGTAVHVDERFAIPSPDLSTRTTGPPRSLFGARDRDGRDVTGLLRSRDGRRLGVPEPGAHQGVTADHWVEIDLGPEAVGRDDLVLLASGWVRPMDSSASIALAQGDGPAPRSLALEVPDGDGGWQEARSDLGFPAGKSKTIVLDLGELLPGTAPTRLRLRTNLEVFWDAVEWAVVRPGAPLRARRIAAAEAELRFRGFSVVTEAGPTAPETPVYRIHGTRPRWRDLTGYYTRFGDVRELLAGTDDRYVIMNAGDELALRFVVPPPPPEGWVRDFVLVTDGWGKNGDYNTRFSDTVLPLPSHDSPEYDRPPGRLEDDPVHRRHPEDWRRFHTRYVTPGPFREALVAE